MNITKYLLCFSLDMNMLLSGNRGQCSKYDISIAEGNFKGHLTWKSSGKEILLKLVIIYI